MLANDVIHLELVRLIRLTEELRGQMSDLTARLELVENREPKPVPADA